MFTWQSARTGLKSLYCSSAGVANTLLCFRGCCPKLLKIAFLKLILIMFGRLSGKWLFCSDMVMSHGRGESEVLLHGALSRASETLLRPRQDLKSHPLFLLTLINMVTCEYLFQMFFLPATCPPFSKNYLYCQDVGTILLSSFYQPLPPKKLLYKNII